MKRSNLVLSIFLLFMCLPFLSATAAETKIPGNISLKLKGAKQKPVPFSHETHVRKEKIDCVVCHHRDKSPSHPQACTSCHPISGKKSGVPQAINAFHTKCQSCHNTRATQGTRAPTKCVECHKG